MGMVPMYDVRSTASRYISCKWCGTKKGDTIYVWHCIGRRYIGFSTLLLIIGHAQVHIRIWEKQCQRNTDVFREQKYRQKLETDPMVVGSITKWMPSRKVGEIR